MSDSDKRLVSKILEKDPQAWQKLVDRILPAVMQMAIHVSTMRSASVTQANLDQLVNEFMAFVVSHDFRVLRYYQGKATLQTYLLVTARRFLVNHFSRTQAIQRRISLQHDPEKLRAEIPPELRIDDDDDLEWAMDKLKEREADLVRGYYIDLKTIYELSQESGFSEEAITTLFTRLKAKLNKARQKNKRKSSER